jgi:pseudouridine-5'-phosphate glycosidase
VLVLHSLRVVGLSDDEVEGCALGESVVEAASFEELPHAVKNRTGAIARIASTFFIVISIPIRLLLAACL